MNDHLIESWNSVVTDQDDIYHLGDFALGRFNDVDVKKIFDALNGRKHLIYGNHDPKSVRQLAWHSQNHYNLLKIGQQKMVLFHYPIVSWDSAHYGAFHLFGHVHGKPQYDHPVRALDMGVDAIGPVPLSFNEISARLSYIPLITKEIL